MPTSFVLNGKNVTLDADPSMPVLWAIREHAGLTGTKFGCGMAQCGACTVHLEVAVRSCVLPLAGIAGKHVTTIEGLQSKPAQAVQAAWVKLQVPQCGYCQSGQIMSATALLEQNPKPTDADIDAAMNGNLCRSDLRPHPGGDPRRGRDAGSLTMTIELDNTGSVRPSRRTFLKAAGTVAAVSLTIGFDFSGFGRRARRDRARRRFRAECIPAHHARRHRHRHREARRNGARTGIATIVAEARRRLVARARRKRAGRCALREPRVRHDAGDGRQLGHVELVAAAARSRRQGPRDAGIGRGGPLEGAGERADDGQWRRHACEERQDGRIRHARRRCGKLPVPDKVTLKQPADFKLIGHPIPRVDASAKSNGTAHFTLDTTPGMRVALLQRPPRFGAKVKSFDATAAKAVPGVVSVAGAGRRRRRRHRLLARNRAATR